MSQIDDDVNKKIESLPEIPKPKRGGQPVSKGISRNVRKQKKFLQTLTDTFNFSAACKAAGVSPSTVYAFMARSPEFNALVEEARREAVAEGEGELYRRAVTGYEKPIVYKGEITNHTVERDNQLLMFFLRNNYPERYGDKSSLDVNVQGNIEVSQAKQKLLSLLNINPEDIVEGEFTESQETVD